MQGRITQVGSLERIWKYWVVKGLFRNPEGLVLERASLAGFPRDNFSTSPRLEAWIPTSLITKTCLLLSKQELTSEVQELIPSEELSCSSACSSAWVIHSGHFLNLHKDGSSEPCSLSNSGNIPNSHFLNLHKNVVSLRPVAAGQPDDPLS